MKQQPVNPEPPVLMPGQQHVETDRGVPAAVQVPAGVGAVHNTQAPGQGNLGVQAVPDHPQPDAGGEPRDCTQGKIDEARRLIAEAKAEEDAAAELVTQARRHETRARRLRIDAGLIMVSLEQAGMARMDIYKGVGISAKEGRHYWPLAEFYAGCDTVELDQREQAGRLLSVNQAAALGQCAEKLNSDERERLIKKVRDECPLDDTEFGPKAISQLAGNLDEKEQTLREKLGIEQARVDELRAKAPIPPQYAAEFKDDQIVIDAQGMLLVLAALTKSPEVATKSIDFFSTGGSFVVTRKGT